MSIATGTKINRLLLNADSSRLLFSQWMKFVGLFGAVAEEVQGQMLADSALTRGHVPYREQTVRLFSIGLM